MKQRAPIALLASLVLATAPAPLTADAAALAGDLQALSLEFEYSVSDGTADGFEFVFYDVAATAGGIYNSSVTQSNDDEETVGEQDAGMFTFDGARLIFDGALDEPVFVSEQQSLGVQLLTESFGLDSDLEFALLMPEGPAVSEQNFVGEWVLLSPGWFYESVNTFNLNQLQGFFHERRDLVVNSNGTYTVTLRNSSDDDDQQQLNLPQSSTWSIEDGAVVIQTNEGAMTLPGILNRPADLFFNVELEPASGPPADTWSELFFDLFIKKPDSLTFAELAGDWMFFRIELEEPDFSFGALPIGFERSLVELSDDGTGQLTTFEASFPFEQAPLNWSLGANETVVISPPDVPSVTFYPNASKDLLVYIGGDSSFMEMGFALKLDDAYSLLSDVLPGLVNPGDQQWGSLPWLGSIFIAGTGASAQFFNTHLNWIVRYVPSQGQLFFHILDVDGNAHWIMTSPQLYPLVALLPQNTGDAKVQWGIFQNGRFTALP